MRVLVYGLNYEPEPIGVGKYTAELAKGLAEINFKVRVITAQPHYPGWRVERPYKWWKYASELKDGIQIIRCPIFLRRRMRGFWRVVAPLSTAICSAPVVAFYVLKDRPEAILVVEPTLFFVPTAVLIGKLARCRLVLHVQDLEVDAAFATSHLKSSVLRRFAKGMESFLLKRIDLVITISHAMSRKLHARGVEYQNITVVRNWVDVGKIFPLKQTHYRGLLKIADNTKVVLYSGNIGAKQGLEVLCKAAHILEQRSDIHFIIAGRGPTRASLERNFGALKNITFLDLQPASALNEFLNVADLHAVPQEGAAADLVLPSKIGPILATGRPVVITADAGTEIADFLGDRAAIVPPGDQVALASAIQRILDAGVSDQKAIMRRIELAQTLSQVDAIKLIAKVLQPNPAATKG